MKNITYLSKSQAKAEIRKFLKKNVNFHSLVEKNAVIKRKLIEASD